MLADFAIMSVLLVVGHLLRARVKIFQWLLIPAPLLAGTLALLGGDGMLGIVPFQRNDAGGMAISSYPLELVAMLFATLFMGHQPRRPTLMASARNVGDTFFYNLAAEIGQYGFALLFGVFALTPLFPTLDSGFALMLPAAFAGGHGTAAVVGDVLRSYGWEDALTVGNTLATIGLLIGVIGGLALVHLGTRLGWTRFVRGPSELSLDVRRGFLPEQEQQPIGRATVSPTAIDPLAWHIALVLSAYCIARGIDAASRHWLSAGRSLPLFAVSMLVGAGMQTALDSAGIGKFVDRKTVVRIGSSVSDYLVAFGVASIRPTIAWDYAGPLAVMSLFGLAFALAMLWLIGPRIFHDNWFERSLFVYGWSTGIVATGVLLLRIVDPRLRSRTLDDYGFACLAISPLEILLLTTLPPLVAQGMILVPAGVLIGLFAACLALSAMLVGWFSPARHSTLDALDESAKSQ
jgi:ESS family glutamate:Na+ symporter